MGLRVVVTALYEGFVCAIIHLVDVMACHDVANADMWLNNDHALTQSQLTSATPNKGYGATVPYGHALLWYSSTDGSARGACYKLIVQWVVHDQTHRNTAIAPRLISITRALMDGGAHTGKPWPIIKVDVTAWLLKQ